MTWRGTIRAVDITRIADDDFWDDFGRCEWYPDTVLLKHRKKVVAICHVELLVHYPIVMCMPGSEYDVYGLVVKKVRRPVLFSKYVSSKDAWENLILREWVG